MHTPLISIIVPVYKVEPYLRRCLDSIVNQTYTNLEIILVDDGSPDNCPQICDEYAAKDNRIVVMHKENGGLSDARNAGLDICKGEYISFVDSDDWIIQNYIEILLSLCIKEKADIAIGMHKKEGLLNKSLDSTACTNYVIMDSKQALKQLFNENALTFTVSWGKLYKKELWDQLRFPPKKLYEDAYIRHRLYDKSSIICFLKEPIYFYTQRPDSIMGQTTSSVHAIEPKIIFYHFLKKKAYLDLYKLMLPQICWDSIFAYQKSNEKYLLRFFKESVNDFIFTYDHYYKQKIMLKTFSIIPIIYAPCCKIFSPYVRNK